MKEETRENEGKRKIKSDAYKSKKELFKIGYHKISAKKLNFAW